MRRSRAGRRRRIAICVAVIVCPVVLGACRSDGPRRSYRLDLAAGAPSRGSGATALAVGPLAPGRYITTKLSPQLTFSIGDGWVMHSEAADVFELRRDDDASATRLRFFDLDRVLVLDDLLVSSDESDREFLAGTHPAPPDFIGYLASRPQLTTGNPTIVNIAGHPGTEMRAQFADVTSLPGTCFGTSGPCLSLLLTPKPIINIFPERGLQARFIVLDTPGGRLLIEATAPDQASLAQLDPLVNTALATLQIA